MKKTYVSPVTETIEMPAGEILAVSGINNSGQSFDGGCAPSMFMDDDMDNDCEDESQSFESQCGW
jgi:hypothetical protein